MDIVYNGLSAYEKLGRDKSGVLFMKMGARKVELAFKLIKSKLDEVDYVIWIAPNACLSSPLYKGYLDENSADIRNRVYYFSIECVSFSDVRYLYLYNLADSYRVFCVVDDSLTIKNTEAGRTRRLLAIASKFKYRLILSSMPLTQGLIDLYSQIKFMNPKLLNMTETQFFHAYLPYFEDEFKTLKRWSTPENERKLIEVMRPYIYDSDFDFNYKIKKYDVFFDLSSNEVKSYGEEKNYYLNCRYRVPFMEVVHKFQRIYTICESKLDGLFELLSEIELRREKVIIFVKFVDEINFFKECGWFDRRHIAVISGKSNKQKALQLFSRNVNVLFTSYGVDSLGAGVKLCQNVIFFSQTFDYRLKVKMVHDIERVEGCDEIKIYDFWVRTGLDEMIRKNLLMKQDVLTNVCNIISQEGVLGE